MYMARYGGKQGRRVRLAVSTDHVAVRTVDRVPLLTPRTFEAAPLSTRAHDVVSDFDLAFRVQGAGVDVLRARTATRQRALRDRARSVLTEEPSVQFAGRVLVDPEAGTPVLYTENLFVKLEGEVTQVAARRILRAHGLEVKRELAYARNAYFVGAPEGTGLEVFAIAEALLREDDVELCHPELIRQSRARAFFPDQWHLGRTSVGGKIINAHASVTEAWRLSLGDGITIAVIDNGVDVDHDEFRSAGKIVAPRDVTRRSNDPRPASGDNHGTACAGVACANGTVGASGVAPNARLLPIRLDSVIGSQDEADAFMWAASHGADVISCSWGPEDGTWNVPADPRHTAHIALPDATRLAIDFAVDRGRNGKGCVVVFASGNGNESVDNDGYASYEKVIAVAACNDSGVRSAYSDFGSAVWCSFPSNDVVPAQTRGIWTTDRSGASGYNAGNALHGDPQGSFTNRFGGTSASAPGVAGVVALMLARNPELTATEVREILRLACDRIDVAGGQYGVDGRSPFYGFGRVNAAAAVQSTRPVQPRAVQIRSTVRDVAIRDLQTARLALQIADTQPVTAVRIGVDIDHTWIGDLIVRVLPPAALGLAPIVLHDRADGATDNIKRTYDAASAPGLAAFAGKSPVGDWTLEVEDAERDDEGTLRGFTVELRS